MAAHPSGDSPPCCSSSLRWTATSVSISDTVHFSTQNCRPLKALNQSRVFNEGHPCLGNLLMTIKNSVQAGHLQAIVRLKIKGDRKQNEYLFKTYKKEKNIRSYRGISSQFFEL